MRQGLSELAHEYTAMGVAGPIQLIGRRRGEYPLVQDTVSSPPEPVFKLGTLLDSSELFFIFSRRS